MTQSRLWINEIVEALEDLGDRVTLNQIYAKILAIIGNYSGI